MSGADVAGLLFDFDGTMIDTEWPIFRSFQLEYELWGHELSLAEWQETVGSDSSPDWIERLRGLVGDNFDEYEMRRRGMACRDDLIHAEPLRPGVLAALTAAEERGLGLAVATSSPRSWVEHHLERIDLRHRFHVVRSRDDVEQAKPAPDLFLAAAEAIGVEPGDCVAIEDSTNGAVAAKEAGARVIVAPNRITAGGDFSVADLVVESLADPAVFEFLGW